MSWAKFLRKAAEDLNLPVPTFSEESEQSKTLTDEMRDFFKTCTPVAIKSEDNNMLRYVDGEWLCEMRSTHFSSDSPKEVAEICNLPVLQMVDVENDEKMYPNTRREYATRLLAQEKATKQAEKDNEAIRVLHAEKTEEIADPYANQNILLFTPEDRRRCDALRTRVKFISDIAGHGFMAWFERRIGAKTGFVNNFMRGAAAWQLSTRAYVEKAEDYLKGKSAEDVAQLFQVDPDNAINRKRRLWKDIAKARGRVTAPQIANTPMTPENHVHAVDTTSQTVIASAPIPFTDDLSMEDCFVLAARRVMHTVDVHRLKQLSEEADEQMQRIQKQKNMIDVVMSKANATNTEMTATEAASILRALEVLGV
jgi:hypothetical protein